MQEVYEGVDDKVIQRTKDWLLSRRNGKGSFHQHLGKYGFTAASKEVNNAYIAFALSEVGEKNIRLEYHSALSEALRSGDDYRLALMANTSYNLGEDELYKQLILDFKERIKAYGFDAIKADHSLVRSYGGNLSMEVVALWALAYLKSEEPDLPFIAEIIKFLLENRKGANFGSTQATTLALQAITEYNMRLSKKMLPGNVEIWINGTKRQELSYVSSKPEPLEAVDFSRHLSLSGSNILELRYPHKDVNFPYSLTIGWLNKSPSSNEECLVSLSAELSKAAVRLNETIRMTTRITNPGEKGLPMTIARIGIPGGLSLQIWQLKELKEKGVFDYYEIINEDLVVYFKELGPRQVLEINLDLKAEVQGTFLGRASSAYLYYNDESKFWIPGLQIAVE